MNDDDLTPEPVAPEPVAPEPLAPEPVAPAPLAPDLLAPAPSRASERAPSRRLRAALVTAPALAIAAGALAVGTGAPAPALATTSATTTTSGTSASAGATTAVPAAATVLACPGPPSAVAGRVAGPEHAAVGLVLQRDGGAAPALGAAELLTAAARAQQGGPSAPRPAELAGRVARVVVPGDGPGALVAEPVDAAAPVVAGASSAVAGSGDLAGLSAAACVAPADQLWLVGGTTGPGRSVRLVLANPGSTAVTVDTTVLTGAGAEAPTGLQGLSLAPGEQRAVLLEGVVSAPGALAVHVSASGGAVAGWLQEQVLRGLVPGGTDVVVPGAGPADHLLVPAVGAPADGAAPVLRLAAPGPDPVIARFAVLGPDGAQVLAGVPAAVSVPAGSVVDVPLPGLPAREVGLVVDADAPVLAAAVTDTAPPAGGAGDLAWTASAAPLQEAALVALPADAGDTPLPRARLVLSAPPAATGSGGSGGESSVEVSVLDADGAASPVRTLVVAPGATTGVDVAELAGAARGPLQGLLLTPVSGPPLVAAVRLGLPAPVAGGQGGDLVAVLPVAAPPVGATEVRVGLVGAL